MKVKFLQNLGNDDCRLIAAKLGGLKIDPKECVIGAVVDLPDEAAEFLSAKYKALFEPVTTRQTKPEAPAK